MECLGWEEQIDGQRAGGWWSEAARFVKNQWYCARMVSHFSRKFTLSPHRVCVLNITGKDTISLARRGTRPTSHPLYAMDGIAI